jgi:fatty acid desaturase
MDDRSDQFHRELDRLEGHLPTWARGPLQRARTPGAVWVRALVAAFLIVGGILGIVLPILGFWMVPLGLALLAIDLPFLRGPFARLLAFINRKLASQAG